MVAISKIIGVTCCGVVLCLGLSGHAVSAADDMNVGYPGERIGGQGGRGFEQVYREHVAAPHPGERIGGQSGQGSEPVQREHTAVPHSGERIGGQSGRGYEPQKREQIVAHPGERIDGQVGLGEMRIMNK